MCTCWDCLRRAGKTPPADSPERNRRDVTGRLYSVASGKYYTKDDGERSRFAAEYEAYATSDLEKAAHELGIDLSEVRAA